MVVDPQQANRKFDDIAHLQLRISREEFEKLTIADVQVEESPEQVKAHIKRDIQEGGGEFETKHRTKPVK